nr:MAG: NSP1a protein [Avian astrovirus 13]
MTMSTVGVPKLAPGQGTLQVYYRMKEKFGGTQAWKDLMDSDAIIIQSMNQAFSYKNGDYFDFSATRRDDGWNILFVKNDHLTEEYKTVLRAHSTNQTRLRMTQHQSSERAATIIQLQDDIHKFKNALSEKDKIIDHLTQEIKTLRAAFRQTRETTEAVTIAANRTSWTSAVIVVLAILFTILMNPVNAIQTDCTSYVRGCYLDATMKSAGKLDYEIFHNKCFGMTTIRLSPEDVNITELIAQCSIYHSEMVGKQEWIPAFCARNVQTRLTTATCEVLSYTQMFDEWSLEVMEQTLNMDIKKLLPLLCHIFGALTVFLGSDPWKTLPIFLFGMWMKIPVFALSFALTLFPITTLGFLVLMLWLPVQHHIALYVVHWIVSVIMAFLVEKDMSAVSYAVIYSISLPIWNCAVYVIQAYSIGLPAQIIMLAVSITMLAGVAYAQSTYTIVAPDGTTTKHKRVDMLKTGVKSTLLKMQNAVRGIIPEMPDKTKCIARIDTDIGRGVAFRFMNDIYTIGHVVGNCDTAKITWNGTSVICTVKDRKELFESCDELVRFRLPPEFQAMKPLRLSRIESSDYMQMLAFDQHELVTYTGWCIVDGNWLSNSFNTKPGDSGAPYVDRFGRLFGIHLGTQGIVAQGYRLTDVLKCQPTPPPLQPINEMPAFETREAVANVQSQHLEELGEQLLEKLIQGTKKSFAQMTTEMEKITQSQASIANLLENHNTMITTLVDKVNVQEQLIATLMDKISTLEYKVKTQELNDMILAADCVDEQKKKRKTRSKHKFANVKVLTEEQYRKMLEEGWTVDEIRNAVDQLRDQAWAEYEIDRDDFTEDDEELQKELDKFVFSQSLPTPKDGKRTYAASDCVLEEAKRRIKQKIFSCPHCKNDFPGNARHNVRACRGVQTNDAVVISKKKKQQQPKNEQDGRKGTSQ